MSSLRRASCTSLDYWILPIGFDHDAHLYTAGNQDWEGHANKSQYKLTIVVNNETDVDFLPANDAILIKDMKLNFTFNGTYRADDLLKTLYEDVCHECYNHIAEIAKSDALLCEYIKRHYSSTRAVDLEWSMVTGSDWYRLVDLDQYVRRYYNIRNIAIDFGWNARNNRTIIQLVVFPQLQEKLVHYYLVWKIPFYTMNFEVNESNVHMYPYSKEKKFGISYDSIEWNDLDMAVYQLWELNRKQSTFFTKACTDDVVLLFDGIISCLLNIIDKNNNADNTNNINNVNNIEIDDRIENCKLTLEVVDHVMQHFLLYVCPLFGFNGKYFIPGASGNGDCHLFCLLQHMTKFYYLQHKYSSCSLLNPKNSFKLAIMDRFGVMCNSMKPVITKQRMCCINLTIEAMISNLHEMNQLCLSMDSSTGLKYMAIYLDEMVRLYTNKDAFDHTMINERAKRAEYNPGDSDDENTDIFDPPTKFRAIKMEQETQWRWTAETVEFILSLIIIILSFCNHLSKNGLAKIDIILGGINKYYINYDEIDDVSRNKLNNYENGQKQNQSLFCSAVTIYSFKTLMPDFDSKHSSLREIVQDWLYSIECAYAAYTNNREHNSFFNDWPQIHKYFEMIEYISGKDKNGNLGYISQIFQSRQLRKRYTDVYNDYSIFGRKCKANREIIFHELDNIAKHLGFGKYGLPIRDEYHKVLYMCKNISNQKQCCNRYCRSLNMPLKRCKKCKIKYYCSKRCQKMDWKVDVVHARQCSSRYTLSL